MASNKRPTLEDKLQRETTMQPTIATLFRPREEIEAELAQEQELTKREREALAREKRKQAEEAEKAIRKKFMEFKTFQRKTFVLDPISNEALRIFAYQNRKKLSEVITDMLLRYIPREIWIEARQTIINIEETPQDYLDDVKKLDINSIYYHPRKKVEE